MQGQGEGRRGGSEGDQEDVEHGKEKIKGGSGRVGGGGPLTAAASYSKRRDEHESIASV